MSQSSNDIASRLDPLLRPGYRGQLIARGLARGLLWRDGGLPPDAPSFSPPLSVDLLDHGFCCLGLALELREAGGDPALWNRGLYAAAEALESAVRHGAATDDDRAFHLTMAAAAFHIGGYSARAFSLLAGDLTALNLSSYERALAHLMRRDIAALRRVSMGWLQAPEHSDGGVIERLDADSGFSVDDVVAIALTRLFHRALAALDAGLFTGDAGPVAQARELLE